MHILNGTLCAANQYAGIFLGGGEFGVVEGEVFQHRVGACIAEETRVLGGAAADVEVADFLVVTVVDTVERSLFGTDDAVLGNGVAEVDVLSLLEVFAGELVAAVNQQRQRVEVFHRAYLVRILLRAFALKVMLLGCGPFNGATFVKSYLAGIHAERALQQRVGAEYAPGREVHGGVGG
ncbi:unknown [Prevotella sp. CAG:485]|nr:unknown [Prevotella sp. CAG:485]